MPLTHQQIDEYANIDDSDLQNKNNTKKWRSVL